VDWFGAAIALVAVVGVGWLLGQQYVEPNKRVLGVLAGLLVFGIAWRLDMVSGLGLLVLSLPYPRGTVFGSTTLAFILLLLVIWLLRWTTREAAPPRRTPVDIPVVGLLVAYVISFYNIKNAEYLYFGLQNFQLLVAAVVFFYLIANNIRTEADLRRIHVFQAVSILTVGLLGIYELNHPGAAFIPGWIEFGATQGTEFNLHDVRIGGPFFDYEMLSEYSALSLLLVAFLFLQARTQLWRAIYGGLGVLMLFMLFATVTRGALVALGLGLLYLAWHVRRRLRLVPLVAVGTLAVGAVLGMNYYVSNFTRSGDMFERFGETKFVGWMPDARAGAWIDAWNRWMEHPIIGHGPYYPTMEGVRALFWPHNLYLYLGNLVGFVGVGFFLWLLWKLWKISSVEVPARGRLSYTQAFLVLAHVQLIVFMVDEFKIDAFRNYVYTFQVWLMFATLVAASRIAREERAREEPPAELRPAA
jgi:hypothetical protein